MRWLFWLQALWLVVTGGAMYFYATGGGNVSLWVAVGALAVALATLASLYRRVVKPMRSLYVGMDLLRGQDFGSRLAKVGQRDADKIVGMFNDMMHALKEQRIQVREQNHFLDLLIDVSPMGIIILDSDGKIGTLNSSAASFLGCSGDSSLKGVSVAESGSRLGLELSRLSMNESATVRLDDSTIYRLSMLSFMDKGYAHPFYLIERLTEEVMRAEKRSYEKVIRVIAHEVNNSMGGMQSILDTIGEVMSADGCDPTVSEALEICRQRCVSMSKFISNFAAVVKIPEANLQRVNLTNVVNASRVLLESMCVKHGVRFSVDITQEDVWVQLDSILFEQVLINIVKNAVESIGDTPGGEVTLTTTANPPAVTVADNGKGIPEEVAGKLFTPFFSTKSDGQGIGLMFIREVLHRHGCRFSLRTDPSDGITRFVIRF